MFLMFALEGIKPELIGFKYAYNTSAIISDQVNLRNFTVILEMMKADIRYQRSFSGFYKAFYLLGQYRGNNHTFKNSIIFYFTCLGLLKIEIAKTVYSLKFECLIVYHTG